MYNNQALPTHAKIRITRLELLETGTYNPMYARPFEMQVSGDKLDDISRRVESAGGQSVSGSLLGGVAGSIMRPAANAQHQIPIYMGWNEPRLRFVLYVESTSASGVTSTYIFQGFTASYGVSHGNHLDPNMEFVINSFVRLNTRDTPTAMGLRRDQVVTESAQIINGQIVQDQTVGDVYGMRPGDIYTGIQSGYLSTAYSGYGQGALTDTRIQLHGDSVNSKRVNNLPSNYLANVVSSFQTAKDLLDYGQGSDDIYGRARQLTYEASPFENPFIRQLSHVRAMQNQTRFTMNNLAQIEPQIAQITEFRRLGAPARATLSQAGSTAYWHGSDYETIWASLLGNAIPALMMDLMIGKISFFSTNDTIGGVMQTSIGDIGGLSGMDMSRNMAIFVQRLQQEVLTDLTYEGRIYQLNMTTHIYGDSVIDLKLDANPPVRFTIPSFADGLFASVFTSNQQSYSQMVNDFETLMNALPGQAMNASPVNMGV